MPAFLFNQPTCVVSLPISAYSSCSCCSFSALSRAVSSWPYNSPGSPSSACAFHLWSMFGCTPCSEASCAMLLSSRSIWRTSCALNADVYCFLVPLSLHLQDACLTV